MTVLWYVHDHGRGHVQRARAVIAHLDAPVVVATGPQAVASARCVLPVPVVELPPDTDTGGGGAVARGPWHHAPVGRTLRRRTAALAAIAEAHDCTTAVVDVSMEVTALCSLLGLRTISLRQSGVRTDRPHRTGLACADVVWVPQHPDLEPLGGDVDGRWTFTGAFSRFDDRPARPRGGGRTAVLLVGGGGTTFDDRAWRAATAPPGWRVVIAGTRHVWCNGDVASLGDVDPVADVLESASVVVTSAGWSSIADAVSMGCRLVLVPERRPFDEQVVRARRLAELGLADVLPGWPDAADLGDVLDRAAGRPGPDWARFYDRRGAHRAAAMIDGAHGR